MTMQLATSKQREQLIVRAVRESRKGFLVDLQQRQADLRELYESAAREIQRQLAFYAEGDGSITFQRLDALLKDVRRTIGNMGGIRDRQLENGIGESAKLGILGYALALELAGHGTAELVAVFGKVHRETVEAVYDFIAADGLQLSDRLYRLDLGAKEKVSSMIQRAVVQGESARESAQRLIRGGKPLTSELKAKMGFNRSAKIGSDVVEIFSAKGQENVVHNALRLFRTELARANNEGFLRTGKNLSTVAGNRWNLTASHPRRDICDTYATQNLDGLGPGGYKTDHYPAHAHPECLCFPSPIFTFEEGEK